MIDYSFVSGLYFTQVIDSGDGGIIDIKKIILQ